MQPFDVLSNGEKIMEVPCCSERDDLKVDDPDIPFATGFSGVTNWVREAGEDPITVEASYGSRWVANRSSAASG